MHEKVSWKLQGVGGRSCSKEQDSDLGQSTLARALNPQGRGSEGTGTGRSHLSSSSKVGRHRESH